MVDILSQTREFLDEFNCNILQARRAALLVRALNDSACQEVKALNLVLENRKLSPSLTEVQILKISALAIWWFTTYEVNPSLRNFRLSRDIYTLVSIVLDLSKDYISVRMRLFAKHHSQGSMTPKKLILDVLDEAIEITKLAKSK